MSKLNSSVSKISGSGLNVTRVPRWSVTPVSSTGATGERLVDGVVDDLEGEMMQSTLACVADVHAGALANGLEPLEDLDVRGPVAAFGHRVWCAHARQKRVSASMVILSRAEL